VVSELQRGPHVVL